ncbi:MAG: hypothetical protein HY077_04915 [Elusimicrobia bacterium]|nr:hypothetical protein [Elusimicrobiota bacterium]
MKAALLLLALSASAAERRSPLFNFGWDKTSKACVISYNESWAMALNVKRAAIAVRSACRYDETAGAWRPYEGFSLAKKTFETRPWNGHPRKTDPRAGVLAKERGLFWVKWTENGDARESLAYCSDFLCEDVMLGPAPAGKTAVCVPQGKAMFVPDPKTACPESRPGPLL